MKRDDGPRAMLKERARLATNLMWSWEFMICSIIGLGVTAFQFGQPGFKELWGAAACAFMALLFGLSFYWFCRTLRVHCLTCKRPFSTDNPRAEKRWVWRVVPLHLCSACAERVRRAQECASDGRRS